MSDLLDSLGLDEDSLEWHDLALCQNAESEWFFDIYESDKVVAENADLMCLSCPVQKQCLESGMDGKEWGLWGGIYLFNGGVDKNRNAHKTPEVWDQIRRKIGSSD